MGRHCNYVVLQGMFVVRPRRRVRPITPRSAASRVLSWRSSFVGELVEVALIALVLFLTARIAIQNFKVNGFSMLPSLQNNELILVDKISYDFTSPHRGDVIVFRPPIKPSRDFIKRIIAVPGDTVTVQNHGVYVDGQRLHESYIRQAPTYNMSTIPGTNSDVVPKNDYFVLGDNRNDSDDSHLWGLVPRKNIIGRALIAYWPVSHFGFMGDPSVVAAHGGGK